MLVHLDGLFELSNELKMLAQVRLDELPSLVQIQPYSLQGGTVMLSVNFFDRLASNFPVCSLLFFFFFFCFFPAEKRDFEVYRQLDQSKTGLVRSKKV